MRILLLSQFYPPIVGGEERHVRNLAAALAQRGHTVSVATQWTPLAKAEAADSDGDVRVHRIRGLLQRLPSLFAESERRHAPPFADPELVIRLMRIVAEEKPDIVHAHNWLLASFLPLVGWSKAGLVVTLHDYGLVCPKKNLVRHEQICAGPRLRECLPCASAHYGASKGCITVAGSIATRVWAMRNVSRFIAVSHAVARHSRLKERGARFSVIPNFVPDNVSAPCGETDPRLRSLPQGGYILFVGDLMRLKGIDVLLQAYARLARAPALVLIGRRCRDTPSVLPRNVHIFSMWPHHAIMQAWRRCLFGVLPSTGPEACATVVMEAMASGKPVVATDIGGMPDLIGDGKTGFLVPPGEAVPLTQAMQRLVDDRDLVTRMGAEGLVKAEQLKAASVVPQIERIYREVHIEAEATGRPSRYCREPL
jgi:glycosyltransferase involved in cell wall biosynthesis